MTPSSSSAVMFVGPEIGVADDEAGLRCRKAHAFSPCAILLATTIDDGELRVIVLPVTHSPPRVPRDAVEIPAPTKRRLGLDDDQSWIVLTEGNAFIWPGPDLRAAPRRGPESVALGFLPAKLFDTVRRRFLALHQRSKARFVRRTE